MNIGPWSLTNNVFVAPMAGVTDRPFRQLCKRLGAGYAVSEMAASNPQLWQTVKSSRRLNHDGESDPVAVQIAGADPQMMAQAAVFNIGKGARVIDINMGCPVKKVCNVASGSALLRHEDLVARILETVVQACTPFGIPVTLKTRTGWDREHRNALRIAYLAQETGIAALTLHGRTRADLYLGEAEYDTIAAVKAALRIPVVANGDIDSPQKAAQVLQATGADAVMIGRAAQGQPWIFGDIAHHLAHGSIRPAPLTRDVHQWLTEHLLDHYSLYGEDAGVRSARKHIGWAVNGLPGGEAFRQTMNLLGDSQSQWQAVSDYFAQLAQRHPRLPVAHAANHNEIELQA
jgi:tRNA-dihydrouridine synthase B